MKVLVIPDVHLKPWMFDRADELLEQGIAEKAVCLMDIPDDWNQEYNLDLYAQTYDRAIRFQKDHPDTLWCYGNHDLCYVWDQRETGFSIYALQTVTDRIRELKRNLPERSQLAYIHRIDDVLFLHGGGWQGGHFEDSQIKQLLPALKEGFAVNEFDDVAETRRRYVFLGFGKNPVVTFDRDDLSTCFSQCRSHPYRRITVARAEFENRFDFFRLNQENEKLPYFDFDHRLDVVAASVRFFKPVQKFRIVFYEIP